MNVISFDLVQKNPIFRFFGTFNRPKTPKPVPQKIATLFFVCVTGNARRARGLRKQDP